MGAMSRVWESMRRSSQPRELDQRTAIRELRAHGFQAMAMQPNVFVRDQSDGRLKVHIFETGGMAQYDCAGKLRIEIGTLTEVMEFVRPLLADGRRDEPRADQAGCGAG